MLPQHDPLFMQALADHGKVFFFFLVLPDQIGQFALFTSLEFSAVLIISLLDYKGISCHCHIQAPRDNYFCKSCYINKTELNSCKVFWERLNHANV